MSSLQHGTLNFNKSYSYNFEGGNLSSDAGLLMVRSFAEKLGLRALLESFFSPSSDRTHTPASIIEQLIFSTIAGYSTDNAANSLRHDPVFTRILDKDRLASQPTISRCINTLDEDSVKAMNEILVKLFELGNPVKKTKQIVLDIDSTLFEIYGKQEQGAYNYHYSAKGYHPLMLYNGLNGDLIKVVLRSGSVYTSNDLNDFLKPVFEWLEVRYPEAHILVRGDSGFATPDLYDLCDLHGIEFLVKLKANAKLHNLSQDLVKQFNEVHCKDFSKHHVMYDDFSYQAASWSRPLRVVCRVERAVGELLPRATFIVTTLNAEPKTIVKAYNKRGNMENFIKESKIDFFMESVSHTSFVSNAVKTMIKALAYNLINIMKRFVLPKDRVGSRMLSIRADLIKIACRTVTSARKTIFKLCSSCPHQQIFHQILKNIDRLSFS